MTELPKRKPNRLTDYDYSQKRAYFITICTENKNVYYLISTPTVIGQFKRYVSKTVSISFWQKGFYDHIIRDDEDCITKARYIENNPAGWQEDKYYV